MVGKSGQAIVAAALCGTAIPAFAESNADVRAELAALREEIAQMRSSRDATWLDERRAAEVKALVHEVLADADTRATLLQEGLSAGYDKKFFLQSNDGSFRMNIEGQVQMRYIINNQSDRDGAPGESDDTVNGFELRRTKVGFNGHVGSPRIGYDIVLAADRNGGDVLVEDAVLSYELSDRFKVLGGRFKLPFARQELISSKRQLAVDRSSVLEYFTVNRAEQLQLQYSGDAFKVMASFSDGANTGFDDFAEDTAEYALTGRVDVKLAGDWKQASDLAAYEDEFAAFMGGAFHYEQSDEGATGVDSDYWVATVDALVKSGPVSGQAAVFYADGDGDAGGPDDAWGAFVEAGYSLNKQWQPFARWEYLDVDGLDNEVQIATVGVNYHLRGHAAKFTLDAAWKYAGDNPATLGTLNGGEFSDGLGWAGGVNDDEDQVTVRGQFQLLF